MTPDAEALAAYRRWIYTPDDDAATDAAEIQEQAFKAGYRYGREDALTVTDGATPSTDRRIATLLAMCDEIDAIPAEEGPRSWNTIHIALIRRTLDPERWGDE